MRYALVKPGQWVEPRPRNYKFRCCDCGLVHRMNFRMMQSTRGRFIQFNVYRDNRATAAVRRHMTTSHAASR